MCVPFDSSSCHSPTFPHAHCFKEKDISSSALAVAKGGGTGGLAPPDTLQILRYILQLICVHTCPWVVIIHVYIVIVFWLLTFVSNIKCILCIWGPIRRRPFTRTCIIAVALFIISDFWMWSIEPSWFPSLLACWTVRSSALLVHGDGGRTWDAPPCSRGRCTVQHKLRARWMVHFKLWFVLTYLSMIVLPLKKLLFVLP